MSVLTALGSLTLGEIVVIGLLIAVLWKCR